MKAAVISRLMRGSALGALAFAGLAPTFVCAQSASTRPVAAPTAVPPASSVFVNPRSGADDPRVGLKGGLYDAAVAASGLQLVMTTPKPAGFAPDMDSIKAVDATPAPPPVNPDAPRQAGGPRPPAGPRANYGGTNSDLAFNSKYLFNGNYSGINVYGISDPAHMKLVTSIVCPGGQGDVSVYGHLMFMSVEAANGRMDCGTQGFPTAEPAAPAAPPANATPEQIAALRTAARNRMPDPTPERVKGVRIFDISDISNPKQVKDVQTCRGSHTHTLVVDPKDKDNVYVYVSGSAGVRPAAELGGCSGGDPNVDPETALYTIVVIKVPLAHPEQAAVVNSPRIFQDDKGAANGLWNGGNHGEGTQTTSATRGCHDITVFMAYGLAAGACSGNGILLDITDPVHPKRLDAVTDPNYAFWHSANFSNDGKTVLFTDEWGGGGQPRCRASDPMNWGADAIFDITPDRKLKLRSYYKMPAPQTDKENCVAHNGSMVPVPGRNIEVQSWYQGGVSLMDYTDSAHPVEIGYFDRGPVDDSRPAMGGQWSTYYYNGYIYGSEIARGTDVFKLLPSKYMTQREIDAAAQVNLAELNVQDQPKISWPQNSVTAYAYLDQLARGTSVPAAQISEMNAALAAKNMKKMKSMSKMLDNEAASAKTPQDAERMHKLAEIMMQPSM